MRKKFGEILVEAGVLTEPTIRFALEKQKTSGKRLGQILEEMGRITENDLTVTLAQQFGLQAVKNLAEATYPRDLLDLIDGETALDHYLFPVRLVHNTLYVAIANPLDINPLDDLAFRTGLHITPCLSTPSEIQKAIQTHYFPGEIKCFSEGFKILVVDSQEEFRSAVKAALDKEGYSTLVAANASKAVQLACQHNPDLILLDTILPEMGHQEAFKALQNYQNTRKIPVIALSSQATAEEEAQLLNSGYFDFIAKPFHPVRLTARVKRAIDAFNGPHGMKKPQIATDGPSLQWLGAAAPSPALA